MSLLFYAGVAHDLLKIEWAKIAADGDGGGSPSVGRKTRWLLRISLLEVEISLEACYVSCRWK